MVLLSKLLSYRLETLVEVSNNILHLMPAFELGDLRFPEFVCAISECRLSTRLNKVHILTVKGKSEFRNISLNKI